MKRILLIALTVLVCMSCLTACGASKELTIPRGTMESEFDIELTFAEADKGYTFTASEEGVSYSVEYSGKANKDQEITEFDIVVSNTDKSVLQSKSQLTAVAGKSSGKLTMKDLPNLVVFSSTLTIYGMLSGRGPASLEESDFLIEAICNGTAVTMEGWTMTVSLTSDTACISVRQ